MARYSRTDYLFSARCPNDSRTGRRFSVSGKGGVGTGENAERKRRQTESKTPYLPVQRHPSGLLPRNPPALHRFFHQHLIDTRPVHIDDLEFEIQPGKLIAGFGHPFQNFEDQAAQRIIIVLGI